MIWRERALSFLTRSTQTDQSACPSPKAVAAKLSRNLRATVSLCRGVGECHDTILRIVLPPGVKGAFFHLLVLMLAYTGEGAGSPTEVFAGLPNPWNIYKELFVTQFQFAMYTSKQKKTPFTPGSSVILGIVSLHSPFLTS